MEINSACALCASFSSKKSVFPTALRQERPIRLSIKSTAGLLCPPLPCFAWAMAAFFSGVARGACPRAAPWTCCSLKKGLSNLEQSICQSQKRFSINKAKDAPTQLKNISGRDFHKNHDFSTPNGQKSEKLPLCQYHEQTRRPHTVHDTVSERSTYITA